MKSLVNRTTRIGDSHRRLDKAKAAESLFPFSTRKGDLMDWSFPYLPFDNFMNLINAEGASRKNKLGLLYRVFLKKILHKREEKMQEKLKVT